MHYINSFNIWSGGPKVTVKIITCIYIKQESYLFWFYFIWWDISYIIIKRSVSETKWRFSVLQLLVKNALFVATFRSTLLLAKIIHCCNSRPISSFWVYYFTEYHQRYTVRFQIIMERIWEVLPSFLVQYIVCFHENSPPRKYHHESKKVSALSTITKRVYK
jgi:hypothetical protein